MPSRLEESIARSLRACLERLAEGAAIEDSEELRHVFTGFENFLPAVLAKVHHQWRHEGMDGFHLGLARKTAPREAEFFALCILITDQTLTPIHVGLRVCEGEDDFEWLECRVGESGEGKGGMVRLPYDSPRQDKLLATLPDRIETIDWAYHVGFGER